MFKPDELVYIDNVPQHAFLNKKVAKIQSVNDYYSQNNINQVADITLRIKNEEHTYSLDIRYLHKLENFAPIYKEFPFKELYKSKKIRNYIFKRNGKEMFTIFKTETNHVGKMLMNNLN